MRLRGAGKKAVAAVGGMNPLALPRGFFAAGCVPDEGSVRLCELPVLGVSVGAGVPRAACSRLAFQVLELVAQWVCLVPPGSPPPL